MLRFHRTSLLTSNCQTVVNTVNTVGVMGKGLAAAFKERYPQMFHEYKSICSDGKLSPGQSWLWKGPDQWVLNFATKKHWRNPSKLEYVRNGLDEFRRKYADLGIREVAFPRLGCGNGGLDWEQVRPLMVEKLQGLPISVYIHDFEKEIGPPEHHLPLLHELPPNDFRSFVEHLRKAVNSDDGCIEVVGMSQKFFAAVSEDLALRGAKNCSDVLASEEDLFQIWSQLIQNPVSRFDLPETPHRHALKVFSVLSKLPYIRPVNLASVSGKPHLAIEMRREMTAEKVLSSEEL